MDGRWGLGSLGSDKEQGEEGQHASSCFRQDSEVCGEEQGCSEEDFRKVIGMTNCVQLGVSESLGVK
jgi:hypothetical protein